MSELAQDLANKLGLKVRKAYISAQVRHSYWTSCISLANHPVLHYLQKMCRVNEGLSCN